MEDFNKTSVKEFILLAFADLHQFQLLLFIILLLTYITCLIGNITIIALVKADTSLHTPMYFFISVFAVLEILFVSVTIPKLLSNLIAGNKKISFNGCFAQLCAVGTLGGTECYLLAVMAFDRDLAINRPLHYTAIMSHPFCIALAVFPFIACFVIAVIPTIFTAGLEFCGSNEINHFICDLGPLQNLACFVPFTSNVIAIFTAISEIVVPFIIIMGLYIHIIIAISNIKSDKGKQKAFSTCSSHLIVASLFYGTAIIVYISPEGSHYDKFLALMYTVVTPLLNPFIYTLRNKDVKKALWKSVRQLVKQCPTLRRTNNTQ